MADAPKILGTDTLRQAYPKLNQAIEKANKADRDSTNALSTANEAKQTADQTRTELNQAILAGDSGPLAGQLSVGADGTVHPSAQDRLINEYNKVTSQLADKAELETVDNLFVQRNNSDNYVPTGNVSPKAIFKIDGHLFVVTQKPNGNGYIRFRLREGVYTTSLSMGSPAEFLRVVEVLNVPECFVRQFNEKAVNDVADWHTLARGYGTMQLSYRITTGSSAGRWIEYDVNIPEGVYSIGTLITGSAGSSPNVQISIDGEVVRSVSFQTSSPEWVRFHTAITPGKHTIRFESIEPGYMAIAGVNVTELSHFVKGLSFDDVVALQEGDKNQYIVNSGAMDYALLDADTGLWCGSFHGGETREHLAYILDGKEININDGDSFVGNIFEVEQDTNITNKINAYSRQIFKIDGSRELEVVFDGNINLKTLYTNMTTTFTEFDEVLYPKKLTIPGDGTYYLNPGANYVVQRNSVNKQKVTTVMNDNVYPVRDLGRTPFIRASGSSQYNKVYKASIDSQEPVEFTGGSFKTTHIFE
jgi:hypothetical protein